MALRIRKSGRIFCAAMHDEEPGDFYVDDHWHYRLSIVAGVLVTERFDEHVKPGNGEWWWRNSVPAGVEIDPIYDTAAPDAEMRGAEGCPHYGAPHICWSEPQDSKSWGDDELGIDIGWY